MTAVEHELRPGDPTSVAAARAAVAAALTAAGTVSHATCEDAVLAASELVTNAVTAARGRVRLQVEVEVDRARVSVWDDGPGVPVAGPSTPDLPHGRGLPIVDVIAARWGVDCDPAGKWVWAEFPVAVPAPSRRA